MYEYYLYIIFLILFPNSVLSVYQVEFPLKYCLYTHISVFNDQKVCKCHEFVKNDVTYYV